MTVRLLMDQLQADLRDQGISRLPAAWQFLHVDVPVDPDDGPPPLGNIKQLGGHHVSFSSPTNTYTATSLNVESQLAAKNHSDYSPLLGWAPRDRAAASGVPVVGGAGQFRAIGRMLTLPRLTQLREALVAAQARAVAPGAWGDLPLEAQSGDVIYPIVISSMAGGSGSSMFLDVCRLLGTLTGINPATIGCLVYTADVFGELPEGARANVEGNALASVAEVVASISRLAEADDARLLGGMGITANMHGVPPFARLIPIGRKIGGSGAMFGDGSAVGVYRGIARALAGVMMSVSASQQYAAYTIGNNIPLATDSDNFGWGISDADLPFGSLGFASLSLGRDRYMDYAAQRVAKLGVDHLVEGHRDPTSALPSTQQLAQLMDNQWGVSLQAMGLPAPCTHVLQWFQAVAYPRAQMQSAARESTNLIAATLANIGQAQAASWLAAAKNAAQSLRPDVTARLQRAAYGWAETWAGQLETAAKTEFARVTAAFGLPYARELMSRARTICGAAGAELAAAGQGASTRDPLQVGPVVDTQAASLRKEHVDSHHALGTLLIQTYQSSCETRVRDEAAAIGAAVMTSFANDVLAALATAANDALAALEYSRAQQGGAGGLAQLHSTAYADWPGSEEIPDPRWDEAQNEVLLTTSKDFPQQFVADVTASAGTSTFTEGIARLRSEVLSCQWATSGAVVSEEVLAQVGHWRASALPVMAQTNQPAAPAKPSYRVRVASTDVLDRSRRRLESPGDVFARFAHQSIIEYLDDPAVSDVERLQRRERFVREFRRAMSLAQPLVGVDPQMVQRLHSNASGVQYIYTFSEIPFGANHPVATALTTQLSGDHSLATATHGTFQQALTQGSTASRIGLFGSYGKYSPLCFTSLLEPIKHRWASSTPQFRRSLWQWKRTRPLPSALAMSPEEAIRVVAGWYLGRLLGLVRGDVGAPSQVATPDGWLTFGDLLESPEVGIASPLDVLPAVMMSHAWAVIRCAGDPGLTPLRPYAALRRLVDSSDTNQAVNVPEFSGTTLLRQAMFGEPLTLPTSYGDARPLPADPSTLLTLGQQATSPVGPGASSWDAGGLQPSAGALPQPGAVGSPESVLAEVQKWVEDMRRYFFGGSGRVVKDSTGAYVSSIRSVEELQRSPLHVEMGPLVMQACDLLDEMATSAFRQGRPKYPGTTEGAPRV
ncbi:MAG: hypothetical protein IPK24_20075 [Kineosporiaceae bacterium]|nr:hypothetical protein [Kineosporiaceae bacterium]